MFVFRAGATAASRTISVQGLDAERAYRVRFQNTSREVTASGARLVSGISVSLPELYSAEILHISASGT